MTLTAGMRLGPYEITGTLGAGGMGEVYLARDTKLDRDVAIKVLPEAFAADPERIARFQREAKTLAALNHPHIAAIYGIEESDSVRALVMELVEGADLSQRIARAALPLEEALPIARQIAEALEAAHEQGIIHRDLKPANVKVRPDGVVKVLDFGLAKLAHPEGAAHRADMTASPTITSPAMMTGQGVILGTAAYMSPEQAKGREADKRSDVWAFGCVLYEMLTGKRAFSGEDVADTLANVLKIEPDWNGLPVATPPAIHRLLHRCLAKDRRARLPDIGVARLEIEEANHAGAIEDVERVRPPRGGGRRAWLAWTAVALCLLAGAGVFGRQFFEAVPASLGVVRFQVDAPEGGYIEGGAGYDQLAVSPDGRRIAFRSGSRGTALSLYVRALDSTQVQQLRDTDRGSYPFWSPDSRRLGFAVDGKLKTIDVANGTVQTLCDASVFRGGTWNGDGVILFSADGVLHQVPVAGGEPVAVTRLDTARGDQLHRSPQFLPDGRHFLFTAVNRDIENSTLQVGDISTNETEIVDRLDSIVQYASSGYLLFGRRGALMARPFDPGRRLWTGEAISVADTVRQAAGGAASFSVSAGGVLAYDAGSTFAETQLTWVSRGGQMAGTLGPRGRYHTFSLAPDEKRAVVERAAPGNSTTSNLWLLDGERSTATVFTPGTQARHPAWSPDGGWIVYSVPNPNDLVIKESAGLKEAEPLLKTLRSKLAVDWSPDGKAVVFQEQNPETGMDLGLAPLAGSRAPTQLLHTRFAEQLGQLSPNGRFMAYVSNETGRDEVYVVNVPEVTRKWPVSNAGGGKPRWRRDGNELFFVDAAGMLMSVSIGGTQEIEAGVPKPLFELQAIPSDGWNYAVSADGQRFLVLRSPDDAPATPITVVLNWSEGLKRLVPTN